MHALPFFFAEPPQAPHNVTIHNVTLTSFCVTWTAGFEGGGQQTFVLTYSTQSGDVDDKHYRDFIPGSKGDDVITYCVEDLEPGTLYDVVLSAENVFGTREDSAVPFNVTTMFEGKKPPGKTLDEYITTHAHADTRTHVCMHSRTHAYTHGYTHIHIHLIFLNNFVCLFVCLSNITLV